MTADDSFGRLDDDSPAYTMGRAAALLGTTQGFLRALGEAHLITPPRSDGGHRRYSRYQLRIAARAPELVDHGIPIDSACRVIIVSEVERGGVGSGCQVGVEDHVVGAVAVLDFAATREEA
ncbi:helix-turn-helix domain-containing protein [Streptomyces sp. NPDC003952]